MKDIGLVQIYTGDGKGKTTAAIGQGIRALGRGFRVYMVQFLKGGDTGELRVLEKLSPGFQVFRFEKPRGFFWTLSGEEKEEEKEDVDRAFEFCRRVAENSECDMLILDEIMGTISDGLLSSDLIVQFMKDKPKHMELILTGRDAPQQMIGAADLVTEMKQVKHYFNSGIPAREGIEY